MQGVYAANGAQAIEALVAQIERGRDAVQRAMSRVGEGDDGVVLSRAELSAVLKATRDMLGELGVAMRSLAGAFDAPNDVHSDAPMD